MGCIEPLVQNALNLLNTKYQNQCTYSIDKIYGSAQFDLSTALQVKIRIQVIAPNVYYIDSNAVDGPQSSIVVQPYNASNDVNNNYGAFEGRKENTSDSQKPLVQTNVTMK